MLDKICSLCLDKPENQVTLSDYRNVVKACVHRAPKLIAYHGFYQFTHMDMNKVKCALKYWEERESQHPRALRERQ